MDFKLFHFYSGDHVINVGAEWRILSNDNPYKDPSRVGDAETPLLDGGGLTTKISKVGQKIFRSDV